VLVYAIKDATTGEWWSHNRWGTVTSIPDLYATRKPAEWQTSEKGKCGMGLRWLYNSKRIPTIIEMNLTEV